MRGEMGDKESGGDGEERSTVMGNKEEGVDGWREEWSWEGL